jgi:transposase
MYLYLSRSRNSLRAVTFDGSGWWILSMRLERGSFGLPAHPTDAQQIRLEPYVLAALLHGFGARTGRRWYHRAQVLVEGSQLVI